MKKALITGIYGSCATYLAEYLLKEQNLQVQGIARWHTDRKNQPSFFKDIQMYECDLLDLGSVIRVIEIAQPDYIFHLASTANVALSFLSPISIMNNNVNGSLNLLEAIRITKIKPKIQYCGTSEVYGQVSPDDLPIKENQAIDPVNVYAISKLTQEKLFKSYFLSYGIESIITRAFGYINPRRPDIFSSAFAHQIARIEKNQQTILHHGNLNSVRTLMDVRDVCEAYWIALEKCTVGDEYNIGSEIPVKIGDFLNLLISKSSSKIECMESDTLIRPIDVTLQIPSVQKFVNKTNFKPKYTLNQSIDFLLEHYRNL